MIRTICFWGLLAFMFIIYSAFAQKGRIRIVEYNVENLFDTIHCEGKQDADFTPQGAYHWNSAKYWSKMSKLARIIAGTGGASAAEIVGLVEIENDSVVYDLTQRTKLRRLNYKYLVTHSVDERGINVALLYQPVRFRPFFSQCIRVSSPNLNTRSTRDVLHIAGETFTGDTLDIFLCHLPSKRGGKDATSYREKVARCIRDKSDSVMHKRNKGRIIIMGDFNAYYPEPIFEKSFGAIPIPSTGKITNHQMYLITDRMKEGTNIKGTYKFQGEWNQLDNFIVSGTLLKDCNLRTGKEACHIVTFPCLLLKDKKGKGVHPYRTFLGKYYQGGYSDHLPLLLDLMVY